MVGSSLRGDKPRPSGKDAEHGRVGRRGAVWSVAPAAASTVHAPVGLHSSHHASVFPSSWRRQVGRPRPNDLLRVLSPAQQRRGRRVPRADASE
jgi:hypothetical protein